MTEGRKDKESPGELVLVFSYEGNKFSVFKKRDTKVKKESGVTLQVMKGLSIALEIMGSEIRSGNFNLLEIEYLDNLSRGGKPCAESCQRSPGSAHRSNQVHYNSLTRASHRESHRSR